MISPFWPFGYSKSAQANLRRPLRRLLCPGPETGNFSGDSAGLSSSLSSCGSQHVVKLGGPNESGRIKNQGKGRERGKGGRDHKRYVLGAASPPSTLTAALRAGRPEGVFCKSLSISNIICPWAIWTFFKKQFVGSTISPAGVSKKSQNWFWGLHWWISGVKYFKSIFHPAGGQLYKARPKGVIILK